ncbi:MAG: cation:dicarboxylase symporter family transporter, partial [Deltaproteobacteria bacterium]
MQRFNNLQTYVLLAVVLGYLGGAHPFDGQHEVAHAFITMYLGALKLTSLPIVFLALCTTIGGMRSLQEFAAIGRHVVRYTLSTTVIAASTGLALYLWVDPVRGHIEAPHGPQTASAGYLDHLVKLVPTHVFAPFIDGN